VTGTRTADRVDRIRGHRHRRNGAERLHDVVHFNAVIFDPGDAVAQHPRRTIDVDQAHAVASRGAIVGIHAAAGDVGDGVADHRDVGATTVAGESDTNITDHDAVAFRRHGRDGLYQVVGHQHFAINHVDLDAVVADASYGVAVGHGAGRAANYDVAVDVGDANAIAGMTPIIGIDAAGADHVGDRVASDRYAARHVDAGEVVTHLRDLDAVAEGAAIADAVDGIADRQYSTADECGFEAV